MRGYHRTSRPIVTGDSSGRRPIDAGYNNLPRNRWRSHCSNTFFFLFPHPLEAFLSIVVVRRKKFSVGLLTRCPRSSSLPAHLTLRLSKDLGGVHSYFLGPVPLFPIFNSSNPRPYPFISLENAPPLTRLSHIS